MFCVSRCILHLVVGVPFCGLCYISYFLCFIPNRNLHQMRSFAFQSAQQSSVGRILIIGHGAGGTGEDRNTTGHSPDISQMPGECQVNVRFGWVARVKISTREGLRDNDNGLARHTIQAGTSIYHKHGMLCAKDTLTRTFSHQRLRTPVPILLQKQAA